jgi:signal transduction histidine kinase
MRRDLRFPAIAPASVLPYAAAALALVIFVFDTVTDLEIAVAVFYVVVVLMSVSFCRRRGVVLVSAGCMGLTLLSILLTSTGEPRSGLVNCIISLSAIGATAYLALRIKSAEVAANEARAQLAHIARVTTLGELTASIAHEINQPLAAVVTSGNACLRWLGGQSPNLEKARQAVERIVKDATRASDVIGRIRSLAKRAPPQKGQLSLNDTVVEIVALIRSELDEHAISLATELAADLPPVSGDRIQLQQVLLNLIMNAIEAIAATEQGPRELCISSTRSEAGDVVVAVRDTGIGLDPGRIEHVFEAFHTTKPGGMGMGLSISRSIVEAHGGRVWAVRNEPRGAVFRFSLPVGGEAA